MSKGCSCSSLHREKALACAIQGKQLKCYVVTSKGSGGLGGQ